jgi:hypothetical protein
MEGIVIAMRARDGTSGDVVPRTRRTSRIDSTATVRQCDHPAMLLLAAVARPCA